jgi:hypothetical protein
MDTKRIQVYADWETKRRVALAAAKQQRSVIEYCLEAIKQRLTEDDVLEKENIDIPIRPTRDTNLPADLRTLREAIKTDRDGQLIDLDASIDQVREERDHELTGVC